jgi:hypothetical protein
LIRAAIEPSPTARDRGSGGSQEVEADGPAKAVVSVSNTELPVTLHIWIRRVRASAHVYELAVVSSFRGRVGAQRRSIADNSLRTVFGNPSLLCDVARPWLGRELCMSLGAVVAVAQEVGYYATRFCSAELRAPSRLIPRVRSAIIMVCGSRCLPARWPGNSHGLATMPPAVRRLGRLCR